MKTELTRGLRIFRAFANSLDTLASPECTVVKLVIKAKVLVQGLYQL